MTSGVDSQQGGRSLDRLLNRYFQSALIPCKFVPQTVQNASFWIVHGFGTDYRQYFGKRQTRLIQNSREWAADYDRPTIWCKYRGHECVADSSIDPTSSEVDKPEETKKGMIRRTWEPIDKENCAAEVWLKCMQRHDNESSDLWRRQRPSLSKCAWHSYLHRSGDKTNRNTAREQSQQFVTTKSKL